MTTRTYCIAIVLTVICCTLVGTLAGQGVIRIFELRERRAVEHKASDTSRQQQYQAWTKLYHREDLTFEEWNTLRIGNFLDDYHTER